MSKFSRKIVLIPLMTVFLLLAVDVFLISRMEEVPSIYQESHALEFPAFRTKDLKGNIVTDAVFRGRFSVVCLWVTQDPAGYELLSSLSAWREASDKPFQLVGIVGDVRETDPAEKISAAQSLAAACAEHIPHLLVNDEMEGFLKRIRNAPTVCFIDEQGCLVGQPVIGNEPDLIRKEVRRLMEADSPQGQAGRKIQDSLFR